jgi:PAS domain S-box-containing protein
MESDGVAPTRPELGTSREGLRSSHSLVDELLISAHNGGVPAAASHLPSHLFRGEASNEGVRGLLDAFPHLVWTAGADGHAEFYNLGWLEFTGRSEHQLIAGGIFDVLHPEDREKITNAWYAAVKARSPFEADVRIRRHDGVHRICTVRANPVLSPSGEVERWIGTTTDIHDQRELENERLRLLEQNLRQREHLHRLVGNVPGVVWEAWGNPGGDEQQIDFVSSHVESLLGYTQEDWLSTPNFWLKIVHPEDQEQAAATAKSIFETGKSQPNRFRWITRDGRVLWIESYASVLYNSDGSPAGMCGVSIDITERQNTEEDRRVLSEHVESERARIHRIVNAVPGIVWELAPTGEFSAPTFVSDQVEAFTGYTAAEFQQGKATEVLDPEEMSSAIRMLRDLQPGREAIFDLTLRHAAGHHIVLESHARLSGSGGDVHLNGVSFDVTNQRDLERAAARGEELLHVITQNLPAMLCYVDTDERYRFSNRGHQQWWNKKPEEILGHTIREIAGDEFYDAVRDQYTRAFAGEELHFVLKTTHDGRLRHIETSLIPQYDENEEVLGVTVLAQDITARIDAEQASKQSEERLRAIADNSPSLLWLCDDRGLRFFFNRQWYEYTGSQPDENLGDGWHRFLDERDTDRFLRAYAESLTARTPFQIEYRLKHHSGEEHWVLCQAQPRFSETGRFLGLVGSCTDISIQKQAEIAILRSHEHFRLLAESMPHIIWTARPDGTGEYWNRFWFDYTGLTEEQCQRPVLREGVFHADDLKVALRNWKKGIAERKAIEFEIRIRRASDGMYRWHLTRTVPVMDAADHLLSWVGSVIDIHDQKIVHDELRAARDAANAANQAKDHFLAGLSHELRTPLTPVLTTIETLELDEHLPPSVAPHIATIRRNIELEARLIDDLLDLTRITRGKIHMSTRPVEVHGLIANVLEICRRDVTAKRIDIHLGLRAQRTFVTGDPARLQQILWNILQNAVKFTAPEGHIAIRTIDRDEKLRIEITDSGIGIDADRLEKIFRPFEQGAVEITKQFGGLGLGLAISKMLVDMHAGSIVATSEGSGKGSTFTIELFTIEAPTSGPESILPVRRQARDTRGRKILLVDDHVDTASAVRVLLERRGYKITVADTMHSAMDAFASDTFDLVISDIGLPDGSGWELISSLQERSKVHAIALSGFCTEQDIERSRKAGFDRHLTKPFNFNDLHREIEALLQEQEHNDVPV